MSSGKMAAEGGNKTAWWGKEREAREEYTSSSLQTVWEGQLGDWQVKDREMNGEERVRRER